MRPPRRAIVLAAGYGTRLHPFTLDCPKALVPVHGRPILAHTLERLAGWGVEEIAVNVHTHADQIVEALPGITPAGCRTVVSFEPEILGTGGALRRLGWFWGPEPLWICNADIWAEVDPSPLLRQFESRRPLACLWMVPGQGPQTVRCSPTGEVEDFRSTGLTFSGLHLTSGEILETLPQEETFCSVIPAYENAMKQGRRVLGVEVPGSSWMDIGTPQHLLEVNGGSVQFPGSDVGPGIRLQNAIVGQGAVLRGRRTVSGQIVSARIGLSPPEQKRFPKVGSVELLPVRGSDRSYRRLFSASGTSILSVSGEDRPENTRMASHTRFLRKQGIRVPELLSSWNRGRCLELEDVGRVHLLDRLQEGTSRRNRTELLTTLRLVARLHACRSPRHLEAPFDRRLVRWEHDLFFRCFLDQMDPDADRKRLRRALSDVGRRFLSAPRVLVHRDLQSTNVLWHKGSPVLIDFQGMRKGPASYDLGSFLADPYVNRSREEQEALLEAYNAVAQQPVDLDDFRSGVTQRLCQALGAYGRLGALPGTGHFRQHIPAAVHQLSIWAADPVLQEWAASFSERQRDRNGVGGGRE